MRQSLLPARNCCELQALLLSPFRVSACPQTQREAPGACSAPRTSEAQETQPNFSAGKSAPVSPCVLTPVSAASTGPASPHEPISPPSRLHVCSAQAPTSATSRFRAEFSFLSPCFSPLAVGPRRVGLGQLPKWPRSFSSPLFPWRSDGRESGQAGWAPGGSGGPEPRTPERGSRKKRGASGVWVQRGPTPAPSPPLPPRPGPGRGHRLLLRPAPPARTLPPDRARAVPGHVSRGAGPRGRTGCGMERRKVFVALDVLCLAVGEGSVPAPPPRAAPERVRVPPVPSVGPRPGLGPGPREVPWPVPPGRGQRGRHLPGRCPGLRASAEIPRRGGRAPAPASALSVPSGVPVLGAGPFSGKAGARSVPDRDATGGCRGSGRTGTLPPPPWPPARRRARRSAGGRSGAGGSAAPGRWVRNTPSRTPSPPPVRVNVSKTAARK